ncbi:MAG TPA: Ig-like domain-containing protein, partial [Nitrososphaera sp.]
NVYVGDDGSEGGRIQIFSGTAATTPTILSKYPPESGTDISVTPCVCILFKEKLTSSTVNTNTISLLNSGNQPVTGQVSYKALINGSSIVSFNPDAPLSYSSSYTAKIKGGAGGIEDLSGNPLANDVQWSFTTMTQPAAGGMHTFAGKWGSEGVGRGQFGGAFGLAIDPATHDILVADQDPFFSGAHTKIQRFGSDGRLKSTFGENAVGSPIGIAVDPRNSDIYVISPFPGTIHKFSSAGVLIDTWGPNQGSGPGQFDGLPSTLDVDSAGNVYIADFGNSRVQKFSSTGTFITAWGSFGSGPGQFRNPTGIAFGPTGNVYVSDSNGFSEFTNTGTFVKKIARSNPGAPWDIAVDDSGNIYETYNFENKVRKFAPDGSSIVLTWGGTGTGDGLFGNAQVTGGQGPHGIVIDDSTGKIYVMDTANHRIQVFGPDATAPTISVTSPADTDTGVSITPCACITFSEQMLSSTITTSTITLQEPDNDVVPAGVSYDPFRKIASLNPSSPLAYSTTYTVTVKGGASGVK